MALVVARQCISLFRAGIGDIDNSLEGRYSDSTILQFIDRANKRVVGDVWFPDSRIIQPTTTNVQLYEMPLLLKVFRVYVAGQPAVPSDLPTLEGQQIGLYDSRATGVYPPTQDAPPGSFGISAPLWTVQTPLSYPIGPGYSGGGSYGPNSGWAYPAPDAQPWNAGQQPRYYWRGGWIGIIPQPANTDSVDISIDCVRQPNTITDECDELTTPDNFIDAIVYSALAFAIDSDKDPKTMPYADKMEAKYEREKRRLIAWRPQFEGEQRDGPKLLTLRRTPILRRNRSRC